MTLTHFTILEYEAFSQHQTLTTGKQMAKKKKLTPQQKQKRQESLERKDFLLSLIKSSIDSKPAITTSSSNPAEMNSKVSAMLMSMCEPTFEVLQGEEKLIVSVAVISWNMTICPGAYTFDELKQSLKTHKGISEGGSKLVIEIAEVLKQAKDLFYPEVRSIIQNYTFKDLSSAYHLQTTVAPSNH